MADPAPVGGPAGRFEADLRALREASGLPLERVQEETRIPLDVLRRFEAGQLLGDDHYNEVYLKALLRAYATAVGVPPPEVVEAYAAERAGRYDGALRHHLDAGATPATRGPAPEPTEPEPPPRKPAPPKAPAGTAPAVAALKEGPAPARESTPAPEYKPRTVAKERVQTHAEAASTSTPIDRSWGMIIAGTVVGLLAIGAVLFFLLRDDGPELEPVERPVAAEAEGAEAAEEDPEDEAEEEPAPASPAPRLALPIAVTVVADAGGDGLQNFRVTEAPDDRRPYWLEPGAEQTFSSAEALTLWGEAAEGLDPGEVTLRMQGITWDPQPGQVLRLDPQRGQALLDSLHRLQSR